jgi:hypothetical protein
MDGPISAGRSWALCHSGERPWTVNGERKMPPKARARKVAEWREAFAGLAREQRVPRLGAVAVQTWPLASNRRALQHVGACVSAAKAAIDGLRDAGVLDDDGPDVVREITFTGTVVGDLDGLMLVVTELVPTLGAVA